MPSLPLGVAVPVAIAVAYTAAVAYTVTIPVLVAGNNPLYNGDDDEVDGGELFQRNGNG